MGECVWVCQIGCVMLRVGPGTSGIVWVRELLFLLFARYQLCPIYRIWVVLISN